ncbi:hypothetical protein QJS83_09520 [Bdellovibrio sp. 22V]|uniref:hypothetical protein n=1 Tax=Bdellovibrio TaxID=958 RepID=UPI002542DDA9|nr:hypothetical protein [Bdellovibrio sp. 22V]WII70697.1 hypothetical protein QJS83_09520 [Bdellovibrio sp. 22V]
MILMWLGSFVLMMFGLTESQKRAAVVFSGLQKRFLDKGFETSLGLQFIRALDLVILEASPQKSLYTGMALYNLRILNLSGSVLIMGLSTLGAWWALLLGLLFLSFNGMFLLGICSLGLVTVWLTPKTKNILQWILATGLFLIGGELMLRQSSILQTTLGQSDLAFFLADGRFPAVLSLLVAGLLLSFVIRMEFWSMALALGLLVTNTISFNGALGLVTGERAARMILFWWHTRSLNQDCRRIGWQLSVASIIGVVVGFLIAGEARNAFYFSFSSDMSSVQDRTLQFIILFSVILIFQWIAQMVWGHFGSRVKVDELQDAKYFPPFWISTEMVSPAAMSWGKDRVHKRLNEVRYHLQGLNSLKEGQVPEHIQKRLKEEEQQLSRIHLE